MKTRVLLVVAAAAVVATLFSCTRELSIDINTASREMCFTAAFADEGTKTAIQPDGASVFWAGDESINVFTSSGKSAKFTSAGTGARATAEFTGSFSGSPEGDTFYAVYPYNETNSFSDGKISLTVPTRQTAVEGTFADDLFPSVAVSDNDEFRFYHVCGGFRFTLSQEGIRRITFEAVGGESLAGKAAVSFGEGNRPSAEVVYTGLSCIALDAPEGQYFKTGTWYYIVALPTELSAGYKLSFYKDDSFGSKVSGTTVTIKRGTFGSKELIDSNVSFTEFGYVDLDLPSGTLWATTNIGAETPEEYGHPYAWGETEPKSSFEWENYKWCNGSSGYVTKYNTDNSHGIVDGNTILEPDDDAANINWGGGWRMPTIEETAELESRTDRTWTTRNGVKGWQFTSLTNGNSIFIPQQEQDDGAWGLYWTSSLYLDNCTGARILYTHDSYIYGGDYWSPRSRPRRVRPVKNRNNSVTPLAPEAIDLGLSVKWAPYNVGATKPEEYGDYFAWGETEKKEQYTLKTYKWYDNTKYTKYTSEDGKKVLDREDDAASANWGGLWRTPKRNEWEELSLLCTWTWQTQNGVDGYKVTGPNGNSIFLPAAGRWSWNNDAPDNFTYGNYLSSSADLANPEYPWGFWFNSKWHKSNNLNRVNGESVRPVYGPPSTTIPVESVSLRAEYTNPVEKVCTPIDYDHTKLYADVYPSYATNSNVTWSSSDPSVATVDYGRIIPVTPGRTTVVATTEDGGFQAGIEVIVIDVWWDPKVPVDMGLSVEWSPYNLDPDDIGEPILFAWGETEPKEQFSWDNYKYGNGPSLLTKYNDEDGMYSLDLEDDAANVFLGEGWRIPSADEWLELKENCSWSLAEMHSVTGFIVESPITGEIIFIPEGVSKEEDYYWPGGYWSSDLSWGETEYALMMEVGWTKNDYRLVSENRFVGHPIRPVYDPR